LQSAFFFDSLRLIVTHCPFTPAFSNLKLGFHPPLSEAGKLAATVRGSPCFCLQNGFSAVNQAVAEWCFWVYRPETGEELHISGLPDKIGMQEKARGYSKDLTLIFLVQ